MGVVLLRRQRSLARKAAEHQHADLGIEDRRQSALQQVGQGFGHGGVRPAGG